MGVEPAGGLGEGLLSDDMLWFNELRDCGHPSNEDLIIPYPSESAQGIGSSSTAIDGDVYNVGVTVQHRCCSGHCSCETFLLERSKTLYPHAVTAALLIAKRHLGEQFVVHSNGGDAQWSDARQLCQRILGYGDWFGITEEKISDEERQVTVRTLTEIAPPG